MSGTDPAPGKVYAGEHVTVTFDAARCLHAAECIRGAPTVFDTSRRPWVDPDQADADQVAEVVRRCPSGALHYELAAGPDEVPERPTRVSAVPGGPLWLRGDLVIETDAGAQRETRAALCRCGSTANRPYCDASGDCGAWHAR